MEDFPERFRRIRKEQRRKGTSQAEARALRDEAVAYVEHERAAGISVRELAERLDVALVTLHRWLRNAEKKREERDPSFQPVVLSSLARPPDRNGLSVVTPAGYRVEGLELDDVLEILRVVG